MSNGGAGSLRRICELVDSAQLTQTSALTGFRPVPRVRILPAPPRSLHCRESRPFYLRNTRKLPVICDCARTNRTAENALLGREGGHCPGFSLEGTFAVRLQGGRQANAMRSPAEDSANLTRFRSLFKLVAVLHARFLGFSDQTRFWTRCDAPILPNQHFRSAGVSPALIRRSDPSRSTPPYQSSRSARQQVRAAIPLNRPTEFRCLIPAMGNSAMAASLLASGYGL